MKVLSFVRDVRTFEMTPKRRKSNKRSAEDSKALDCHNVLNAFCT